MKTLTAIIIPALLFSTPAFAMNSTYSGDSLTKLYAELHYLHEVGQEIHQKYDEKLAENPAQIQFCKGEYNYLLGRAKAAVGMANRLFSEHKDEYVSAAWKALECVSCQGDVNSCDAVPPALKTMEEEYKASKAAQ